jgi:tetratricopeptide (TPR) repeat protein
VLDALPAAPTVDPATSTSATTRSKPSSLPAARRTGEHPAPSGAPAVGTSAPPKATDPAKLKLGMQLIVRKDYERAIKVFDEILRDNAADRQAQQWLQIAHARFKLKNKDNEGAFAHYQKALEIDEENHEARKFVREHSTQKRLNSIPFGRYFVKKS